MADFEFKSFSDLSNIELYELLKLRTDVFVVEQNCPYPELDNKDLKAIHVYGYINHKMAAVGRILPPGISYSEWSLGRIATSQEARGKGLGYELMNQIMEFMKKNHPNESIRISAQTHLEKFYNSFGFVETGKSYLEDGIPHIEMFFKYVSN